MIFQLPPPMVMCLRKSLNSFREARRDDQAIKTSFHDQKRQFFASKLSPQRITYGDGETDEQNCEPFKHGGGLAHQQHSRLIYMLP